MGVLRGAGRPGLGAALNIVAYWLFGAPLAALFGLELGMGVRGFWLGLMLTSAGQALVQLCVISRLDWQHEVQRTAAALDDTAAAAGSSEITQQTPRKDSTAAKAAAAGRDHPDAVLPRDVRQVLQQQQQQPPLPNAVQEEDEEGGRGLCNQGERTALLSSSK